MDYQPAGPWLIAGGYTLALALLLLGGRFDGRRPTAAAVSYALCGILVSETSLYWLSAGSGSAVPGWLWFAFPLVIAALAAWRGYRRKTWTGRLDASGEPSFGVLPQRGIAVTHASSASMATAVEFAHNGHRLLGVEYGLGGSTAFPGWSRTADLIDGTYALIQLRTPEVPSVVITPTTGAFEPERFTPLEDARITRNTAGAPKPDALLQRFETGTEFDRRFTVTTSDPEFAKTLLSPGVRALLEGDSWFRVHEVAFHGGSLWTSEAGTLTEETMFADSRRLAILASTVDWEDADFRAVAAASDTSDTGWLGGRRGPLAGVRGPLNRRREAAGRQPLSSLSLVARTVATVALVLPGLALAVNSLTALTGLAPEARLTVTATLRAEAGTPSCTSCGSGNLVDGTYELDGGTHEVKDLRWMSFGTFPERGDVVDIAVTPLWWHPLIEGKDTGIILLLIGLAPVLTGALLAKATFSPRPRRL
ncbi:hypothetical protein P3102_03130 [Amycolatopsis sp. QT-25]|uniref:hypothetical protein n=1 Tax=Amycolatopsis sp. QT-25 TaxID=3034022 RepID=UPI0023EBB825|nr:hypothetical protein [Amycolatopsis sp. QT-25]WET80259.1 hypothetical protein P3102_03130 [Amycolatopsis sp. QT-25]